MIHKMMFGPLALCMAVLTVFSSSNFAETTAPAKVMMVGVFHFANPGLDKVKSDQINVTTAENQAYLIALSKRLSEFKPTHVLLECSIEQADAYQKQYQQL